MNHADAFFAYARKRYQLKLDKEADFERPWTDDHILQQYRFCNVFREDDKVTRWVRQHITFANYHINLVGAMVIARWFNRIETLELLLPMDIPKRELEEDIFSGWADGRVLASGWWESCLWNRLIDVRPIVTGAYMIKTPAKMSKLEGIIWCLKRFLPQAQYCQEVFSQKGYTLENATAALAQFPYLGPFMAYEVVTDLRHTPILCNAPDIMTWANPGPGAARGLARVCGLPLDHYDRHKKSDVDAMQVGMRQLLKLSKRRDMWPTGWPVWEMRDVEHTLCEFDKYERARLGEGAPKQRYAGGVP